MLSTYNSDAFLNSIYAKNMTEKFINDIITKYRAYFQQTNDPKSPVLSQFLKFAWKFVRFNFKNLTAIPIVNSKTTYIILIFSSSIHVIFKLTTFHQKLKFEVSDLKKAYLGWEFLPNFVVFLWPFSIISTAVLVRHEHCGLIVEMQKCKGSDERNSLQRVRPFRPTDDVIDIEALTKTKFWLLIFIVVKKASFYLFFTSVYRLERNQRYWLSLKMFLGFHHELL